MFTTEILRRTIRRPPMVTATSTDHGDLDRTDLRIRNLLDDPGLRRAMGLDEAAPSDRPEPRFDRRRLLERAAA